MLAGIIDLLKNDVAVTSAIGAKIFPVQAEQDTKRPYMILRRNTAFGTIVKSSPSEVDITQFEVLVFAETYKACIDIQKAVRSALDNFSGTSAGVDFKRVWYNTSQDFMDESDRSYCVNESYIARHLPI